MTDVPSPSRGRPPKIDPELPRLIVAEAAKTIEAQGAHKLSMRAIAERLGFSRSAYLYYFDDPSEVVGEVACLGFRQMFTALESAGRDKEPLTALHDMGVAYVRFGVEKGRLYRVMFSRAFARGLAEVDRAEIGEAVAVDDPRRRRVTRSNERRIAFFQRLNQIKLETWRLFADPFMDLYGGDAGERWRKASLAYPALLHGLVGELIDEGLFADSQPDARYRLTELRLNGLVLPSIEIFFEGATPRRPSGQVSASTTG